MTIAVRLEDTLVRYAAAEGLVHRRSTPKKIEFWAEIGRVAGEVGAEDLITITQSIRRIRVEPVIAESVTSSRKMPMVNADNIVRSLWPDRPEKHSYEAALIAEKERFCLLEEGQLSDTASRALLHRRTLRYAGGVRNN